MKKINNKVLAVALLALVGIFVLAKIFRSPSLEGNMRKELVTLERDEVTRVEITKADSIIDLKKNDGRWTVTKGQTTVEADSATVARMLQQVQYIKSERLASRKKEKWSEFNVDSTATRVAVYYGRDKKADINIGKFGLNQNPNGSNSQFGMGQGIEAFAYVRLEGDDEVYVVNGFLNSLFPASVSEWRKKEVKTDSIK